MVGRRGGRWGRRSVAVGWEKGNGAEGKTDGEVAAGSRCRQRPLTLSRISARPPKPARAARACRARCRLPMYMNMLRFPCHGCFARGVFYIYRVLANRNSALDLGCASRNNLQAQQNRAAGSLPIQHKSLKSTATTLVKPPLLYHYSMSPRTPTRVLDDPGFS